MTTIKMTDDELMLTRHGDFVTLGGKLTRQDATARLKEIKRRLVAL